MVKKVTNKKVFRFGSYGWVGGAQKDFEAKTEKSGWDLPAIMNGRAPPQMRTRSHEKALEAYCDTLINFS